MTIETGLDILLRSAEVQRQVIGRIAYLGHSASVSYRLENGLDELIGLFGKRMIKAFGPQHGFGSVVQDNMIGTDHFIHPAYQIPVYRKPGSQRKKCWKALIP
jgi:hypothetical protein